MDAPGVADDRVTLCTSLYVGPPAGLMVGVDTLRV
jgi:hypothetical protein